MLQALIVEFKVKPEFVDDFARAMRENATSALENEPGCLFFDVCRDPADPSLFFLYELYEDDDAIQAHQHSKHYRKFAELSPDWIASKTIRKMQRTGTSKLGRAAI